MLSIQYLNKHLLAKDELQIRKYIPGDEEQIVPLLELVFDKWPHFDLTCSSLDHWKWKYLDNPTKKNKIVVATHKEQIIGCDHALLYPVKIADENTYASQGCDSVVYPDYQGQGIYSKLLELTISIPVKNLQFTYWATGTKKMIALSEKLNYPKLPYTLLSMTHISDIDLHLENNPGSNKLLKNIGIRTLQNIAKTKSRLSNNKTVETKYKIENISKFDDRINVFWSKIEKHLIFSIKRDKDYLTWRYCDPRGGDYQIKQIIEEDEIVGYCVYRINRFNPDYPRGFIVDLLTLAGRIDLGSALIDSVMSDLKEAGVNVVNAWLFEGHPLMGAYTRNGFINSHTNFFVYYKSREVVDLYLNQEWGIDQFHFQAGDTDII
jgi:GNAT superfamily N-acetyltransferase